MEKYDNHNLTNSNCRQYPVQLKDSKEKLSVTDVIDL